VNSDAARKYLKFFQTDFEIRPCLAFLLQTSAILETSSDDISGIRLIYIVFDFGRVFWGQWIECTYFCLHQIPIQDGND